MKGNVIIIDDEWYIRKGLRKLIEGQTSQWIVAGEASNGQEGLELLGSVQPDLAIIDIRMPIMNGIELAERMYRQGSGVKLVILTGHKDFVYAQAAVKFGVSDFLLKPCPEEEVTGMLDRMFRLVHAERRQRERERELQEDEAMRALLLRLPLRSEMLPILREQTVGRVCLFLGGFAESPAKFAGDMPLLQFAMRNIVEDLAEGFACKVRYVPLQFNLCALFIALPDEGGDAEMATERHLPLVHRLKEELTGNMSRLLGVDIRIADAGSIQSLDQVPELYERAALSGAVTGAVTGGAAADGRAVQVPGNLGYAGDVGNGMYLGHAGGEWRTVNGGSAQYGGGAGDTTLEGNDGRSGEVGHGGNYRNAGHSNQEGNVLHAANVTSARTLHDDWSYVMASGTSEQLRKLIEEELAGMEPLPPGQRRGKELIVSAVLHSMERKLARMSDNTSSSSGEIWMNTPETADRPGEMPTLADRLSELDQAETPSALRDQAERFLFRFSRWQESNNSLAVRRAERYIEENYKESCSLSEVAAHVHFNPTYLSTLFKRITGERFVNYITRIRMEQARLLLHNTEMKIAEVAHSVGYDDPNYFTTAFSRQHGMSPNQYRKKHSSEQSGR